MSTQCTLFMRAIAIAITISTFGIVSACNLPIPMGSTPTSGIKEIPEVVLSEVAATIKANLKETQAQATDLASSENTLIATPSHPAETISSLPAITQADQPAALPPEATQTLIPTSTHTPTLTNTSPPPSVPQGLIVTQTQVLDFSTPLPTQFLTSKPGANFKIKGINIHSCKGIPWAIFRIQNSGTTSFESLLLHFHDMSSNQTLYGPAANNAPFMRSDRTCSAGGIDVISPGEYLFLGNSLGVKVLKGHTVRASIALCTQDGLGGFCSQYISEFVIP